MAHVSSCSIGSFLLVVHTKVVANFVHHTTHIPHGIAPAQVNVAKASKFIQTHPQGSTASRIVASIPHLDVKRVAVTWITLLDQVDACSLPPAVCSLPEGCFPCSINIWSENVADDQILVEDIRGASWRRGLRVQ
jgi:hypothetical protein